MSRFRTVFVTVLAAVVFAAGWATGAAASDDRTAPAVDLPALCAAFAGGLSDDGENVRCSFGDAVVTCGSGGCVYRAPGFDPLGDVCRSVDAGVHTCVFADVTVVVDCTVFAPPGERPPAAGCPTLTWPNQPPIR